MDDEARRVCAPVQKEGIGKVCRAHGAVWWVSGGESMCLTRLVLRDVANHRQVQFMHYGDNRWIPDGTGPETHWLASVVTDSALTAEKIEALFRKEWDWIEDRDDNDPTEATWLRMLREEVAEAFAQDDDVLLEKELTQVAALATSWIEKIRERRLGVGL